MGADDRTGGCAVVDGVSPVTVSSSLALAYIGLHLAGASYLLVSLGVQRLLSLTRVSR